MKIFIFLLMIFSMESAELVHGSLKVKYVVETAPEWNSIFKRTSGWTGADGIFSCREPQTQKTLFVFSDTLIGEVDKQTRQRKSMKMINNSMAVLDGNKPADKIQFLWNRKDGQSAFIPGKSTDKTWYWLQDGFVYKGDFYNFPMRLVKNPHGAEGFQFKTVGVDILKVPLSKGLPEINKFEVIEAELHRKNLFYGAGVLKDAGDGYIYVYGRLHTKFTVDLTVARIKPDRINEPRAWRFWNGNEWSGDIQKSVSLGEGGPELSVCKIKSGPLKDKYILVSMPISRSVFIRIGESPKGPFGPRQVVYTTPEAETLKEIYTYNAKGHPVLSEKDELIISYNVNSTKLSAHKNAEIYHPRFIRLKFLQK